MVQRLKSNVPTGITAYRDPETGEIAGSYPQPAMTDREILKLANEMASNHDGYGVAFYNDVLIAFARKLMQAEAPRMEAEAERLRTFSLPAAEITLQLGEHYAGIILGKGGEPDYHLILMANAVAKVEWKDAKDWAKSLGGELPTRREQSLLYVNLKDQFESAFYWSSQPHESEPGFVWCQHFGVDSQCDIHHTKVLCAQAVRRVCT